MASADSRLRRRPPCSAVGTGVGVSECDGPRKRPRLEGGSVAYIPVSGQVKHSVSVASSRAHCSSVVDVFDEHARVRPTRLAVVHSCAPNECMTWLQLQEMSVRIAAGMNEALHDVANTRDAKDIIALLLRRSNEWIAATVAVLRCGRPFVWLSAGEAATCTSKVTSAIQAKWWSRNAAILNLVEPRCIISNCGEVPLESLPRPVAACVLQLSTLLRDHAQDTMEQLLHTPIALPNEHSANLLCYMFTGGSTGAPKCVRIPHAMALHEVKRYPDIVTLTPEDRVLQHTSVFWAASAWGQIDIALAFGATICVSLSAVLSARELCAAGISVLGVSPSQLASIMPAECPSISCIFSWGEALPAALAARWRSVPGLRLFELLISTEYWLSFYCDEAPRLGGPVTFKAVEGIDFAVLPHSDPVMLRTLVATIGATGELCIRGPAVTQGYLEGTDGGDGDSFIDAKGGRYYHTKDTVVLVAGRSNRLAIEFQGRSDSMIKVGAEFVNLRDVESRLEASARGRLELNTCVLPPPCQGKGPNAHAFIATAGYLNQAETATLLHDARAVLPHGTALHFLSSLPRNSVTGKIDRQSLSEYAVKQGGCSEPLDRDERAAILWRLIRRYPIWWFFLGLLCCIDVLLCASPLTRRASTSCSCTHLTLSTFARATCLPFVWLATIHLAPSKHGTDLLPFGRLGIVLMIMIWGGFRSNGPVAGGLLNNVSLIFYRVACLSWLSLSAGGAFVACQSGNWRRLVSWPIAFWIAVPHKAEDEIRWWLSLEAWRWWLREVLPFLPSKISGGLQEAPQCGLMKLVAARICKPHVPVRPTLNYEVGSTLQVWSVSQEMWLDAKIIIAGTDWVTVKYLWPDGQEFEKELRRGSDCLRQRRSGRLVSMFRVVAFAADVFELFISAFALLSSFFTNSKTKVSLCFSRSMQELLPLTKEVQLLPQGHQVQAEGTSTKDVRQAAFTDKLDQETKYQNYPLTQWLDFERRWWEECAVDFINCASREKHFSESMATGHDSAIDVGVSAPEPGASSSAGQLEAKVIALVEKHLHLIAVNMESHLAGASSLSFMALCRALRVNLGCELQPEMAMRCDTVGQLLRLAIEQRQVEQPSCSELPSPATNSSGTYAVYFAPSQLKGQCAWIYESDQELQPALFLEAARRLIQQHEALRYALLDPPELLPFVQLPACIHLALNTFLSDLPWCGHLFGCRNASTRARAAVQIIQKLISFALKAAWPRIGPETSSRSTGVGPLVTTEHAAHAKSGTGSTAMSQREPMRVVACSSWEDVAERIREHKRDFVPPFSIALFLLSPSAAGANGKGIYRDVKSYVHIICTHAFSDGFTCFPLMSDLTEFYDELAHMANGDESVERTRLMPRPPSAFATLQERLFDALELQPPDAAPEQSTLRPTEFYLPEPQSIDQPNQYNHQVMFESGAIDALRSCASAYAVPLDVMLLGVVVGALFRTGTSDETGRLTGYAQPRSFAAAAQLLTLALYAPMRDSVANEAMVGLFSDWRELNVAAAASPANSDGTCNPNSATVLGLLLQLTGQIRSRQWRMFSPLQNSERILVNILALDERSHGSLKLRQTRRHEYNVEHFRKQRKRVWRPGVLRPMRLTLEQYEPTSWWLSMDLSDKQFPPAWCRAFVCNLERTVHDLIQRPLTSLL